jgi:hypothetical protein
MFAMAVQATRGAAEVGSEPKLVCVVGVGEGVPVLMRMLDVVKGV